VPIITEANQSLLTTEEMKRKIITRIESKIGVVWVMVLNATYINISVIPLQNIRKL
jgi:hypothetical protein